MNQLDQLGMRISHIDSAFDQWIKQQNTNYNTFAVLYTLATEACRNSANEFLPPSVKNVQSDCLPIWTHWPN